MARLSADVVICGAGIAGVSAAYHLVVRQDIGRVVIVDWKTGRGEGRFNEVQIAGYALYASRQGWVASPEEIQTELAYLAIPRYVRRPVDAKRLERATAFIRKSASNMRALLLDADANVARCDDFPMIDRPRTCRRCNFRRLCFPRGAAAWPAPRPEPVACSENADTMSAAGGLCFGHERRGEKGQAEGGQDREPSEPHGASHESRASGTAVIPGGTSERPYPEPGWDTRGALKSRCSFPQRSVRHCATRRAS